MISLYILQSGKTYDISGLVSAVSTTGRKGAAGRTLTATLLDAPEFDRSGIDVYQGCRCIVQWNGTEILRGLVTEQSRNKSKKLEVMARDNLIYFANNDDTFSYKDKTASQIFTDICTRFQISVGTASDTGYVIPSVSIESGKLWDAVLEALSKTYQATGIRYYVKSEKGVANLYKRVDATLQWVIENGANLIDYDYSRSISELVTRVKMMSDTGSVVAEATDTELESRLGIFQKIIKEEDGLNAAQLNALTDNTLVLKSAVKESLSVTGLGILSAVAGGAVRVIIPDLDINQSYYIDEDTHTFKGEFHQMQLTLSKSNEFEDDE